MSTFIDESIIDCRNRLDKVETQMEQLRREAASIQGELRAYERMKAKEEAQGAQEPSRKSESPRKDASLFPSETFKGPRVSPMWEDIFRALSENYPRGLTTDELKTLAAVKGHEVGESFRTALWHHAKRENIERRPDGRYVANKKTAAKIGVSLPMSVVGGRNMGQSH